MRYLVVRSDGLIPAYPVFVLDGHNPAAAPAMFKYAHASKHFNHSDIDSLFKLAQLMKDYAGIQPQPITFEDRMILEAISTPGGKAKLYELNKGGHR